LVVNRKCPQIHIEWSGIFIGNEEQSIPPREKDKEVKG